MRSEGTAVSPHFQPVCMLAVEISQPLPDVSPTLAAGGQRYEHARMLVCLHGQPLGMVKLTLAGGALSAACYAGQIWNSLHQEISRHLEREGFPGVTELTAAGIPAGGQPACKSVKRKQPAPFISIIIATHDRPDYLKASLDSLLTLDYPAFEIIVVDNAPQTQETAVLVQQGYGRQVKYIREDRPGVSAARNRGLLAAKGEIAAFTDDDVIVNPGWLNGIKQGFEAAANVACVTGLVLPAELETPSQLWFEQYGGFNKGFQRCIFDLDSNRPQEMILFPYAAGRLGSGVNMAFKTAVLRDMGGFDTALGTGSPTFGGEDLALYFQVITGGYQLVYEPSALLYHIHRREYTRLRRQMYGYGVGLTAFLTKCVLARPRQIFDFMRKLPYGLFYAFSVQSPKNKKKQTDYPRELTNLERKGMLVGPFAYLYSRWQARHV